MLAQRERGRAALLAGRDDEAYRSLVGAAALPSSGTDVQLLLGIASGRVGRSDQARAAFAQFLVRERAPGRFFRAAREAGSPALRQLGVEAAGAILHHFPDDPALREDLGAAFP